MTKEGHNYINSVADEYGEIVAKIKLLEERKELLRDDLITFIKDVPAEGSTWTVSKSESSTTRIDSKKVRELLGDRAKDVETISKQIRLNVKPTLRFGVGSN
jgi:hypothetical protein